ncbi:DUF5684 domain-containing protein [Cryobacterium sp. Y62]|uniref:DUF5684 domain-containing protein n=1 Tax=Cryobacterium sp. Y62 TaxID=2048284 RepID=UPI000CE47D44|nr:DUF5684 domain-containing protein [Cryobacterium sp. Y62]
MDESSSGAIIAVVVVAVLLGLGLYVFTSIALGKVFVKLGEQAWKAWVPIVNTITLFELGRYSALWVVGLFIPVIDIGAFIVFILAINNVNRRLGRGGGFTLLYLVAFPIWAGVLGFGKSVNTGWLPVPAATGYVPFTPVPPLSGPAAPSASPIPVVPVPAASPVSPVPAVPTVPAAPPRAPEPVRQSEAPSSAVATGFPVPVPALLLVAPPLSAAPVVPAASTAANLPSVLSTSPATPTPPVVRGLPTGPPPFYVRLPTTSPVEPPIVTAPPAMVAPPTPFVAPVAPPAPFVAPAPLAAPPVVPAALVHPVEPDAASLAVPPLDAPPPAVSPAPVVAATNAWARPAPVVQAAPVAPAPVTPPVPIPVPIPAVSAADLAEARTETETEDDLDETMIVVRRIKPWTLETEHGLKVSLTKPVVLLGRNPARGSAHPDAQLVLLQDPGKTVSKTHARLDFVDGAWGIRDLQSTNGIVFIDGAGDESELDAGASASLTERFLLGELAVRIYLED